MKVMSLVSTVKSDEGMDLICGASAVTVAGAAADGVAAEGAGNAPVALVSVVAAVGVVSLRSPKPGYFF
jgi:hypothetical protein